MAGKKPDRQAMEAFERAFAERMGLSPVDYLVKKLLSGSAAASVSYLFEMIAAEVAAEAGCTAMEYRDYAAAVEKRLSPPQKREYGKLVRDKIPELIAASGQKCTTRILSEQAYLQALDEKLSEELAEYQQSKALEELADLLEVMGAVVKARGYTWEELTRIRKEKREKRGAFQQRIYLESVEDP